MSLAYTIAYARKTATQTVVNGLRLTNFAAPEGPRVGTDPTSGDSIFDRISGSRWTAGSNSDNATGNDAPYASVLSLLRTKNLMGRTA